MYLQARLSFLQPIFTVLTCAESLSGDVDLSPEVEEGN